jgi:hypothetical protein
MVIIDSSSSPTIYFFYLLSNYDVGGRPLRVDFADVEMTRPSGQDGVAQPQSQQQQQQPPPPPQQQQPPPSSTASTAQMPPSGPGVMGQRGPPPNIRDYRAHDEVSITCHSIN